MQAVIRYSVATLMLSATNFCWSLQCPPQPQQTQSDVKNDVYAAAGRLGPLKAVEARVKTEIEFKNLIEKYPNTDRLYLIQLTGATLCGILNESKSLSDSEKIDRWTSFQTDSFRLLNSPSVPRPETAR